MRITHIITFIAALTISTEATASIPADLETCIDEAESCMSRFPLCGDVDAGVQQGCIAAYEDCSYDIPEAHSGYCRIDWVWCVLECDQTSPTDYQEFCFKVEHECAEP